MFLEQQVVSLALSSTRGYVGSHCEFGCFLELELASPISGLLYLIIGMHALYNGFFMLVILMRSILLLEPLRGQVMD